MIVNFVPSIVCPDGIVVRGEDNCEISRGVLGSNPGESIFMGSEILGKLVRNA